MMSCCRNWPRFCVRSLGLSATTREWGRPSLRATTSTTNVTKTFQVNTFHGGLKAWMDLYRHCVCPGSYLKYEFSIYVTKLWQLNQGIPSRSWRYLICIISRGLYSYNARLLSDDVTAVDVSYWRRRELPKYARLHRGRISIRLLATQFIEISIKNTKPLCSRKLILTWRPFCLGLNVHQCNMI